MEVTRKLSKENAYYSVKQRIQFKNHSINDFVKTFDILKESRYIIADSFKSANWKLPSYIENKYVQINFGLDIYKEINTALKGYVVVKRSSGRSPIGLYSEVQALKKIIIETAGFKNVNQFNRLISNLMVTSIERADFYAKSLLGFISFYQFEKCEEFKQICEAVPGKTPKNRNLPNFQDVLLFDDIVNDFFNNSSVDDRFKFTPIFMWWFITNIIPMRPSEFLLIKWDCTEIKNDGSFWLSVPRIKNKSNDIEEIIWYQPLQINEGAYNLIVEFKTKILELNIRHDYLFSYDFYKRFRKRNKNKESIGVIGTIKTSEFRYLLARFYKDVVENTYSYYGLERILPSHTRHFAIINMFLQGFNVLSIARMAGHDEIQTSENYYNHAEHFATSYVYHLAQKNLERNIEQQVSSGLIGWRREVYKNGSVYSLNELKESYFRRVDYGFCRDKDFPDHCVDDCKICPFYIFKPSVNEHIEGIKWLEDESKHLEHRIKEQLALMDNLWLSASNMNLSQTEEESKSQSQLLQKYMDHKAIVDARIMEEELFGQQNHEKNC